MKRAFLHKDLTILKFSVMKTISFSKLEYIRTISDRYNRSIPTLGYTLPGNDHLDSSL
jgi:hypothetical protein